jgi:hypothetical protein
MKRFLLVLFCLVLLAGTPSSAAVFERDWKTPGDGLLTYDDINQREWLDLTETQLFKFPGGTLEEQYLAVVAETAPGGMFNYFAPAASCDVIALAASAGIDTSTELASINKTPALNLIDLLGVLASTSGSAISPGVVTPSGSSLTSDVIFYSAGRSASSAGYDSDKSVLAYHGVWLYRQVPEPQGILLFLSFSIILLSKRYQPCWLPFR